MSKRLCKSQDKMVFGVCAGLAEYMDCDKTVMRLIFALAVIIGGLSLWVYLIAALIMPSY